MISQRFYPLPILIFQDYVKFKSIFGEDGAVMVLGVEDPDFYKLDKFNGWYQLGKDIKSIEGIEAIVSVAEIYNIRVNETEKKFEVKPLILEPVASQAQLDSLHREVLNLPFYRGFIVSEDGNSTLMAITFDKKMVNSKSRIAIVQKINGLVNDYEKQHSLKVHRSGMPYIRTVISGKIASEMQTVSHPRGVYLQCDPFRFFPFVKSRAVFCDRGFDWCGVVGGIYSSAWL
jgi:hypothetical protein